VDEGFVRGQREGRVRKVDGVKGIGAVRANLVAGCGGWQLETDPGDGLANGSEFHCVVATGGSSMVGRVRDVAMHSVVLLVEGDGGGPFQGKISPPSQVGEAALVVWFAVGPIHKKADYPCVCSKEKVLGVTSTLGDPLCFRLDGVSFVEEPVEAPKQNRSVHQCSIEEAKLNRDHRSYLQNRPSITDSS